MKKIFFLFVSTLLMHTAFALPLSLHRVCRNLEGRCMRQDIAGILVILQQCQSKDAASKAVLLHYIKRFQLLEEVQKQDATGIVGIYLKATNGVLVSAH